MCGIAGILNLDNKAIDTELLIKMTEIVKHRGPDGEGAVLISSNFSNQGRWFFESKTQHELRTGNQDLSNYNIGLAHRRLSIIDLSEKGHQPMSDEDKLLWIVHNGEIYNYIEIRKELTSKGYKFKSNTDTEVILYSYKEWGANCLNKFNGMWAFAIWDSSKKVLFCSRDRFGIKPFYYYLDSDVFIFASEIKQILEYKKYQRKPNEKLIYDFLVIGHEDHTSETFFEGIYQLKGGKFAILDYHTKKFKKERFYDLSNYQGKNRKESDYYEEFKNLFFDSVNLRLRSDVPVGCCLSGGIDSSSVVCTISEIFKTKKDAHNLETFTACWKNEKIDERKYSEEIVAFTGANGNYIFPSSEELQKDLTKLIWHQEEPFSGLSIFAQWSVMKKARERGIPVLLDGQGGDEVFLGYERYYAWFLMSLFKQFKFKRLIKEIKKGSENSKLSLMEMVEYYIYFNFNRIRALHLNNNAKKYMNINFIKNYDTLERIKYFEKVKNIFDLQKTEIQEVQLSHLLKYADRNAMTFAIETRLPFLDHKLVEFALSVAPEYKIRNGWTKNIVREGMKGIIPEKIRKRRNKIGFEVPQEKLLKSLLPGIKANFKNKIMAGNYINSNWFLNKIKNNDISGNAFWKALCLELWLRKFFS